MVVEESANEWRVGVVMTTYEVTEIWSVSGKRSQWKFWCSGVKEHLHELMAASFRRPRYKCREELGSSFQNGEHVVKEGMTKFCYLSDLSLQVVEQMQQSCQRQEVDEVHLGSSLAFWQQELSLKLKGKDEDQCDGQNKLEAGNMASTKPVYRWFFNLQFLQLVSNYN